MQRLCRRGALCRPVWKAAASAAAVQSCQSVRARWLAIPVSPPFRARRCLATVAASSTPVPSSGPSFKFASTPLMLVGVAVVAGTALLYASYSSAASSQQSDRTEKKAQQSASAERPAPSVQHADHTPAASLPPQPTPSSPSSPAAESPDSASVSATLPTANRAAEASQLTNDHDASMADANSNANPTTAPAPSPATTSTVALPASHAHSLSEAASRASQPLPAAEEAYLARYNSAPVDEHPTVRNLRILTANRIDEVVATSPPFLLYLFDPTCSACALYTPIVHALAYALDTSEDEKEEEAEKEEADEKAGKEAQRPLEAVRLYVMNDATDYKPGFLAAHEENVLPILKFFPQSSAVHTSTTAASSASSSSSSPAAGSTSFQYTGSPHLSSILRFLHQQTSGSFDLERALQRARDRLPALRAELADKGAKRLQQSEDWALYLHSPCGRLIQEYSMAELMSKYVEGGEEGGSGAEEKYDRFVQCMEEQEGDTMDYFEMMAMIANETVQQLKDKREKKRRQRESEGNSSDQAKDGEGVAD